METPRFNFQSWGHSRAFPTRATWAVLAAAGEGLREGVWKAGPYDGASMASLDLLMQAVIEDLWRLFRGEDPKRNVTQKQFNDLLPQLGFSAQLRDAGERSRLVAAKDVLRWFGVLAMWANEGYSPTLVGGTIWWNHAVRSCSRMGGPDLGRWVAARFPFRSGIGDDVSGRTVAARRATRLDRPLTPPTAGSREYPPSNIRDSIPQGSRRWFEYHCWESDASQDAELWYRSHSPVTVLGLARNERGELAMESMGFGWSFTERGEAGVPLVYTVRFDDGFEADVTEDELHMSPERFVRPSPPKRPAPPSTGSRGHAGNCTIYNVYEPWFGDDDFPFARDIYDVLDEAEGLFRAAEIRLARDEHIFEVCLDAHGRVLGASTAHEMAGEYPEVRFSIAVHPEARRRGVARELAKRVVDAFGDRELVAWVVNPDVLGLLESLGFSPQSMEWTPDAPFLERRPTVGTRDEYDTILRYLHRAPGPGPGVPSPGWEPPPTPWGNNPFETPLFQALSALSPDARLLAAITAVQVITPLWHRAFGNEPRDAAALRRLMANETRTRVLRPSMIPTALWEGDLRGNEWFLNFYMDEDEVWAGEADSVLDDESPVTGDAIAPFISFDVTSRYPLRTWEGEEYPQEFGADQEHGEWGAIFAYNAWTAAAEASGILEEGYSGLDFDARVYYAILWSLEAYRVWRGEGVQPYFSEGDGLPWPLTADWTPAGSKFLELWWTRFTNRLAIVNTETVSFTG